MTTNQDQLYRKVTLYTDMVDALVNLIEDEMITMRDSMYCAMSSGDCDEVRRLENRFYTLRATLTELRKSE